jgi:hypothetical protein
MKFPRFTPFATTLATSFLLIGGLLFLRLWKSERNVTVEVSPNTYSKIKNDRNISEIKQTYPDSIRKTPAIASHIHTQETQMIALGLFLTGLLDQMEGKPSATFQGLCESAKRRELFPPRMSLGSDGALHSELASYQIRYRAEPLAVEVFFLASKSSDGPSMGIRIPDIVEKGTPLTELRVATSQGPVQIAQYIHTFRQAPKLPPFMASPADLQSFGWVPIATTPPKNGQSYTEALEEINRESGQ